ncbi:hypothetical protein HYS97_02360 [Candidatus Daviesbacteria bacterium]|nr:hypothetical protein [Candidatus Daviesbacteria bacterium]
MSHPGREPNGLESVSIQQTPDVRHTLGSYTNHGPLLREMLTDLEFPQVEEFPRGKLVVIRTTTGQRFGLSQQPSALRR